MRALLTVYSRHFHSLPVYASKEHICINTVSVWFRIALKIKQREMLLVYGTENTLDNFYQSLLLVLQIENIDLPVVMNQK